GGFSPTVIGPGAGRTKRNQPRLGGVDRQAVLAKPFWKNFQNALGIATVSKPDHESSSPGEFHPRALTEPDGSLSTHPALLTRPAPRLTTKFLPIAGLTRR